MTNLIKSIEYCFVKGKVDQKRVQQILKSFKKLAPSKELLFLKQFYKALKRELDQKTLEIESATDLTKPQVNAIKQRFEKRFKVLETKVVIDKKIIGGIKVKIGDLVIDNSLKGRIEQVREAIIYG